MNEQSPLIGLKNTFCKADKKEIAANTGRKARDKSGNLNKSIKTLGGTARFDRSVSDTSVITCSR